jgi:hypothetical protein
MTTHTPQHPSRHDHHRRGLKHRAPPRPLRHHHPGPWTPAPPAAQPSLRHTQDKTPISHFVTTLKIDTGQPTPRKQAQPNRLNSLALLRSRATPVANSASGPKHHLFMIDGVIDGYQWSR